MMLDLKKLFPDVKFPTAEELKAKEDSFSIGDRVKVADNIRCIQNGKIGTIVQIEPEDKYGWKSFIVKFDDEKYGAMGFNSGDIDKIDEKKSTMKINENAKIILTIEQLRKLVNEEIDQQQPQQTQSTLQVECTKLQQRILKIAQDVQKYWPDPNGKNCFTALHLMATDIVNALSIVNPSQYKQQPRNAPDFNVVGKIKCNFQIVQSVLQALPGIFQEVTKISKLALEQGPDRKESLSKLFGMVKHNMDVLDKTCKNQLNWMRRYNNVKESKTTMMKKINENTKITLTIGQLKKLVKESGDKFDPSTCETEYFEGSKWDEDTYSMEGWIGDEYTKGHGIHFTMHDDGDEPILWVEAFGNGGDVSLDISLSSLIAFAKDAEIALNKLREMTAEHPPTSDEDDDDDE